MKLRSIKKEDIAFLFDLRNEEAVRLSSFNTEPIDRQTHKKWFDKKIKDGNTVMLIAEEGSAGIGHIRFGIDRKKRAAEVDIAIAPAYRDKGYGKKILKAGCEYIFKRSDVDEVVALIKPDNTASIKAFSGAGFLDLGIFDREGRKCMKMVLRLSS